MLHGKVMEMCSFENQTPCISGGEKQELELEKNNSSPSNVKKESCAKTRKELIMPLFHMGQKNGHVNLCMCFDQMEIFNHKQKRVAVSFSS